MEIANFYWSNKQDGITATGSWLSSIHIIDWLMLVVTWRHRVRMKPKDKDKYFYSIWTSWCTDAGERE